MNAMLADSQARNPRPSLQTSRQSQTVETYTERFEAAAIADEVRVISEKPTVVGLADGGRQLGKSYRTQKSQREEDIQLIASDTANSLDDHHGECDERKQPHVQACEKHWVEGIVSDKQGAHRDY